MNINASRSVMRNCEERICKIVYRYFKLDYTFPFMFCFCRCIQYEGPTLELTIVGVSHFEVDCEKVKLI